MTRVYLKKEMKPFYNTFKNNRDYRKKLVTSCVVSKNRYTVTTVWIFVRLDGLAKISYERIPLTCIDHFNIRKKNNRTKNHHYPAIGDHDH